jgi:hypothetical protein
VERLRLAELAQASGRPGCERGRDCFLAAVQSRFVLLLLSGREADARTRTGDPFITSVDRVSSPVAPSRAKPHESGESAKPRWRPKSLDAKHVDPA